MKKQSIPDYHFTFPIFLFFVLLIFPGLGGSNVNATTETLKCDIVICGGSFSAPAAALQAARDNPSAKILLIEPTDWLGGQATAQGVSAIDNAWHDPGATLMRTDPPSYYPADYLDFLNRLKSPPPEAPGEGMAPNSTAWVSREAFDPRTGTWLLDRMIAEYPNITLLKMTVVKDVVTSGVTDPWGADRVITELSLIRRIPRNGYKPFDRFLSTELPGWYDPNDSKDYEKRLYRVIPDDPEKGLVVIDASELADVIVLSGAEYTVGRELVTEKLEESGTPPDMDEQGTQAFVFPFCMTGHASPVNEDDVKTSFADFDAYYQEQVKNYFSMGSHSWRSIWTYRRLKGVTGSNNVDPGDVSMQNWYPGNDYPYGTMYKDRAGAAAEASDWKGGVNLDQIARAEKHAAAWYFFMKENRTESWDTLFTRGDHPLNMMGTRTGLARFPYIRGTRRILGIERFRMSGRYFVNVAAAGYNGGSSFRYYDSVGIGNYAVDVHATLISTGIRPPFSHAAPFYIPFRALGSSNVRNLLAAGKLIAGTYVTNAAYRLHPIEWSIGSAAGGAAALMARDGAANYDLLEIPALRELQENVNKNSPISWKAFDAAAMPDWEGEMVVNDFKPVRQGTPFQVEVYLRHAVRAEIYLDEVLVGETITRANGRLVLDVTTLSRGGDVWKAVCYFHDGRDAGILETVSSVEKGIIIDNESPSFSLTGAWTRGTAMGNKWGESYHYIFGNQGPGEAVWEFDPDLSGTYEVSIWYPEAFNRATDAPFTVHHAKGEETFRVNQQTGGGGWYILGKFPFYRGKKGKLVLTNDISEPSLLVVADAVRFTLQPTPAGYMLY